MNEDKEKPFAPPRKVSNPDIWQEYLSNFDKPEFVFEWQLGEHEPCKDCGEPPRFNPKRLK